MLKDKTTAIGIGLADKNDIPQMEEFLKRAREDTTKYIVKELRKGGMQIRR